MTSFTDLPRLPVIDLSLFEAGDPWRKHVAAQVQWAAGAFGFFQIIGHGIDGEIVDTLTELSRKFFAKETAEKHRIRASFASRASRGYFPSGGGTATAGAAEAAEGLHFGGGSFDVFPELPGFRDAVQESMAALTGLGHKLMTTFGRGLGLEDGYFVDRVTGNPATALSILHYQDGSPLAGSGAAPQNERFAKRARRNGVDTTSDRESNTGGFLTLAMHDGVDALQVKFGERWITVPNVPGSLACSVGPRLARTTDGHYVAAQHRVLQRAGSSRLSVSFSFQPASVAGDAKVWQSKDWRRGVSHVRTGG